MCATVHAPARASENIGVPEAKGLWTGCGYRNAAGPPNLTVRRRDRVTGRLSGRPIGW